jgi:hypothetical protein
MSIDIRFFAKLRIYSAGRYKKKEAGPPSLLLI